MDNIAILDNPFGDGVIVSSRGVGIDSKAAKLNNSTKRPVLVKRWEDAKMKLISKALEVKENVKDAASVLKKLGITLVNYAMETISNGAKKLRVNAVVNDRTSSIYNNNEKIDVVPMVEEKPVEVAQPAPVVQTASVVEPPKAVMPEKTVNPMEPSIQSSRSEIHGRHERTGEIPVDKVREAVRNDSPVVNTPTPSISRVERSAMNMPAREEVKEEVKAGDMDLYNNLLHSNGQDDVSRQLQGARKELSKEQEESRKLAEQYGEAVKELKNLKEELENKKKAKEQRDKKELNETLNNLETLKRENLDRTSDLSSIRAEIERLKAERDSMGNDFYDDYHSYGRAA